MNGDQITVWILVLGGAAVVGLVVGVLLAQLLPVS